MWSSRLISVAAGAVIAAWFVAAPAQDQSAYSRGEDFGELLREQAKNPGQAEPGAWAAPWDKPGARRGKSFGEVQQRRAIEQARDQLRDKKAQKDTPVYVFISLGMPSATLSNLYDSARQAKRQVIFVIRGFDPADGGFKAMARELYKRSDEKFDIPVEINPPLFRDLGVTAVPVTVARDEAGVWRKVKGDARLEYALKKIEAGDTDEPIGQLYDITEPDLLKIIQKRVANHDWEAEKRGALERARAYATDPVDRPVASEAGVSYHDPSVRLKQDLTLPDGRVVARRGEKVNPLDQLPLVRHYVVFDPTDPGQRDVVDTWVEAHDPITLIATELPKTVAERNELRDRFEEPVHPGNEVMIKRLGVEQVPALISQEGRRLKVVTQPPEKSDDRA